MKSLPIVLLAPLSCFAQSPAVDSAALFRRLDTTADSELNAEELKQLPIFSTGAMKDRPELLERVLKRFDRDQNGTLSRDEFKALTEARNRPNSSSNAPASAAHPDRSSAASATKDGLSAERLQAAADYSARHHGSALLIRHGDKVLFERYEPGATADTAIHLHSGTKGFWGAVIAAMIEDRLVDSFDELAAKTLPEWRDDARKKNITLRHLLQLNAGLAQDIRSLQGHDRETLVPDLYAHAVQLRVTTEPGRRFLYGPSCYYVLGEIMKRKLASRQETPLDYLRRRILIPIGVETGNWVHDKSGNPHIPNGASLTARNWSKFGQFLLQDGVWEGKPIIRADLIRELRESSAPNPGHGLALWLNRPGGFDPSSQRAGRDPMKGVGGFIYPGGHPDLFAAMGAGKNRMYIIPQLSLVVVRQTLRENDTFSDQQFLNTLLRD